jgi:hypothetical protein
MGASFADPASAVALPNNVLANANALTVSAWVNLTANATNTRLFDFGTDDATNSLYLALDNGSGGMSLVATVGGGTSKTMSIDSRLPTAVWKHVAVTLSSAGAYLYIDGKPVAHDATFQVTPSALGATTSNWIGQSLAGTGPALAGAVDEFYMFRAALSIAQIRTLAAPKTDYSIYHFDEGSGTTAADSSDRTNSLSQALTGTLQGGATWVASPFGTGVMLTNSPSTAPAVQYVALANGSLAGCTTRATFSAWINPTTNTTIAPVLEFGYDSTHYTNVTTYVGGSSPGSAASFYFINGTGSSFVVTQKLTYPSGWTHIAVVRGDDPVNGAGRDAAVYVNGALQTSTTNTKRGAAFWDATASTTTSNFIGKSQVATTPGFNGAIDEVLVSCRPYTADEIKQLAYLPAP